jgi:hypothetical protein
MLILKARAVMVKEGLVTPEGKHAFDRLLSEMITDRHRS